MIFNKIFAELGPKRVKKCIYRLNILLLYSLLDLLRICGSYGVFLFWPTRCLKICGSYGMQHAKHPERSLLTHFLE